MKAFSRLASLWSAASQPGDALAGLLLGLFFASPLPAEVIQEVVMHDDAEARVQFISAYHGSVEAGFTPVAVKIENRADSERSWEVDFVSRNNVGGRSSVRAPFTFTLPAGETRETVVYVPGGVGSAALAATITGPDVKQFDYQLAPARPYGLVNTPIAVSGSLEPALRALTSAPAKPSGRPAAAVDITVMDPARWPADWRTWSPFGLVMLEAEGWSSLDAARRSALHEWVAMGGVLILSPPASSSSSIVSKNGETKALGFGRIVTLANPLAWLDYKPLVDAGIARTAGRIEPWRGQVELLTSMDLEGWKIENGSKGVILFLLVFGVLVGPVNVFAFAPVGKRHRLFLTVPALSLAASLVLGVAIILRDGFGGEGTRRAVVTLLPGENKAVVFQQQLSRTGLLTGRSFSLPGDTLLATTPEASPKPGAARSVGEMEREGDFAGGDWFNSRSRQTHQLRRITPTRARVELVEAPRGVESVPSVQSSVTTTLKDFLYVDERGDNWFAAEVPPGKRVALAPSPKHSGPALRTLAATVKRSPGHFYAFGGATELAPLATLPAIRWSDESILYTGRVEAAKGNP